MNKKTIVIFLACSICTLPVFAKKSVHKLANDDLTYITADNVNEYCPSPDNLFFKAKNPNPHTKGDIHSYYDSYLHGENCFAIDESMEPAELSDENQLENASWRPDENSNYGYTSGDVTTCFYTYEGFTGIGVNLNLRNNVDMQKYCSAD